MTDRLNDRTPRHGWEAAAAGGGRSRGEMRGGGGGRTRGSSTCCCQRQAGRTVARPRAEIAAGGLYVCVCSCVFLTRARPCPSTAAAEGTAAARSTGRRPRRPSETRRPRAVSSRPAARPRSSRRPRTRRHCMCTTTALSGHEKAPLGVLRSGVATKGIVSEWSRCAVLTGWSRGGTAGGSASGPAPGRPWR